MGYHKFQDEDGNEFGSFEVFQVVRTADGSGRYSVEQYPTIYPMPGWYWQACFPGCLPDGEPCGPFTTEADAISDARNVG